MPDSTANDPYARAAQLYRSAGWHGVLPIGSTAGKKSPPPLGWTGHDAPMPSAADIAAWQETHADRNIGLRLPPGVIGLDVDQYAKDGEQKHGGDELCRLEIALGPLPPTWITSARTDGVSGIRLYRVPLGLDGVPINWPGEAAPNIEIIQTGHRYALVWPSVNPEAGGAQYRWSPPGHAPLIPWTLNDLPDPDALPALSETWVRGLAVPYARTEKADLAEPALFAWWEALRHGLMTDCPVVHKTYQQAVDDLKSQAGARHENVRDAAAAIARYGAEGHKGVQIALTRLGEAFGEAVGPQRIASGEWSRLLSGALRLAATKANPPRQACGCSPPALAPTSGLGALPVVPIAPAADIALPTPAAGALTLPEDFWAARESLQLIRQAAHSRVRSGDVVLYGVLARLAALAPHTLKAHTLGAKSAINLFVAVVGASGGGKSSGLTVSRDLVKADPADLEEFPLGSGEGVAEAYMGMVLQGTGEMKKDGAERTERVRKQVRHNVLLHADEGASLNKMLERTGSIVGETLRSAWSGERLGQKNGRDETTRSVPAGSYALGLVVGYQPETVMPLLADVAAGTPQRFLYCWAVDTAIPPRSARVMWPGELPSPFPPGTPTDQPPGGAAVFGNLPRVGGTLPELITYAEEIEAELYDRQFDRATDAQSELLANPYHSQHDMMKVKVSGLLALLEQRRHVTYGPGSDWALAQTIIETSDRVQEYLLARGRDAAARARSASLHFEGEAEWHREHARTAVTAALTQTSERRVAAVVASMVHEGGPMTLGALRKRVTSRDRGLVEPGVAVAVAAGWLVLGDSGRAEPGPSRPAGPPSGLAE